MGFYEFDFPAGMEHCKARLDHLDSLGLELENKTVLELGAGVGHLTKFFEDRNCNIISFEARQENVDENIRRFPHRKGKAFQGDLEDPNFYKQLKNVTEFPKLNWDIIFCYGVLYHLKNPDLCIEQLSKVCKDLFLVETRVFNHDDGGWITTSENKNAENQSFSGIGCNPSRNWVFNKLKECLGYAYYTVTTPNFRDFPTDWKKVHEYNYPRSIFVGSRKLLYLNTLTEEMPIVQERYGI